MSDLTITRGDREYIDGLNAGVGTRAELTAHAELSNAEKNKGKVQDMRARLLAKLKAKKAKTAAETTGRRGRPIRPSERQ